MPVLLFVRLVAPPVPSPSTAVSVFWPVLLPVSVSVRAPDPLKATLPVLVKFSAPVPDASSIPPFWVRVNNRSVLCPLPVYCNVPPSRTRLAAALLETPMLLLLPPSASVLTLKIPPLIVVPPV